VLSGATGTRRRSFIQGAERRPRHTRTGRAKQHRVQSANERGQAVGERGDIHSDPKGEDFCGFKALRLPAAGTTCLSVPMAIACDDCRFRHWEESNGTSQPGKQERHGGRVSRRTGTLDPTCPAPQKLQFKLLFGKWRDPGAAPSPPETWREWPKRSTTTARWSAGRVVCAAFNEITSLYLQPLHALLWETGTGDRSRQPGRNRPGTWRISLSNQ